MSEVCSMTFGAGVLVKWLPPSSYRRSSPLMVPFFPQEENTEDLLSEQISSIENSVISQRHHAVTSVPRTYSSCLSPRSLTATELDILDFTLR